MTIDAPLIETMNDWEHGYSYMGINSILIDALTTDYRFRETGTFDSIGGERDAL